MVIGYIKSCTSCARSKTPCHKPYSLLKQLPIPNQLWDSISMDFIEQLPTSEGFMAILVVIDRLTKQALFIPTHDTIDSPQLTRLFLTHVFTKHGTLGHITSDCGTEFVSHFSHSLGKLLGMKLHFTSRYHLEGDGQMEQINQVLEQYLHAYMNYQQDNWAPCYNQLPRIYETGLREPDLAQLLGQALSHHQAHTRDRFMGVLKI